MNRIRSLREEKQISMREAAQRLGLPYTTYANYERGAREPNSETLIALANFYNTSIDYMLGRSESRNIAYSPPSTNVLPSDKTFEERVVSIRFLGSVATGYNHIANDEHEYLNVPEDWLGRRRPDDFFALRVKGDSMYPKYCNGDEILCLHDESPVESGQVYVVLYGDEEATLKKIECSPSENYIDLVPINPMFPPKRIERTDLDQFRILGRVVRLIRTEDKNIDETK